MALMKIPARIEVTIPDLVGIPAKRRSLGQFQGQFERQITVLEADIKIADPNSDGTHSRCNDTMLELLEESRRKLQIAFNKWNLRLDQLLEEDEENVQEYRKKWTDVSKKNNEAKLLLMKTLSNIKPSGSVSHLNERVETQNKVFTPIIELKPYILEKSATPGKFQEWKRRFESFFLSSALNKAPGKVQHSYFRSCISSQLANLLESQISENLPVFPDPEAPGDDSSCIKLLKEELEKRFPLPLRRLAWFSTKQENMDFSDFVSLIKKKGETVDASSFTTDNVYSYIALSGCSDPTILEEVLKMYKNPTFEQIVQIGTNLEVSRSILEAFPGGQAQSHNKTFKIKSSKKDTKEEEQKRCKRCGSFRHQKKDCPIDKGVQCFKCQNYGHLSYICPLEDSETSEKEEKNHQDEDKNSESSSSDEEVSQSFDKDDQEEDTEEDNDEEENDEEEDDDDEEDGKKEENPHYKNSRRRSNFSPISRRRNQGDNKKF